MTFSQKVKNQICQTIPTKACCQQAFLYSILHLSRGYRKTQVSFHTETKAVADLFAQTLIDLFGVMVTIVLPTAIEQKRRLYTVMIEDPNEQQMVLEYLEEQTHEILDRIKKKRCCAQTFLKGAFLIAAAVVDPQKEYHLEFCFSQPDNAKVIANLLRKQQISFRQTTRKGDSVIYLKDSSAIEELLTYMGALESTFALMNLKIEKELRNHVNRLTNCETANIDKTVRASGTQIDSIKLLLSHGGTSAIPDELQETARLRMENPSVPLSELCRLFETPIDRSTLSRRLKKLCEMAQAQ